MDAAEAPSVPNDDRFDFLGDFDVDVLGLQEVYTWSYLMASIYTLPPAIKGLVRAHERAENLVGEKMRQFVAGELMLSTSEAIYLALWHDGERRRYAMFIDRFRHFLN